MDKELDNMTTPVEIVKESEVEYRFITNYYDEPLQGSCYYKEKLYHFRRKEGTKQLFLIHLNKNGERKWKLKQFFFELCVGYQWSWHQKDKSGTRHRNPQWPGFYYRNPVWLYKILFKLYYKLK